MIYLSFFSSLSSLYFNTQSGLMETLNSKTDQQRVSKTKLSFEKAQTEGIYIPGFTLDI